MRRGRKNKKKSKVPGTTVAATSCEEDEIL